MKNLIGLTLLLGTLTLPSCSLSETAPEKVLTAFNEKFPDAKKVSWEKENETEWEAEFKVSDKAYSANFSTIGDWKETEFEINTSEIPAEIRAILDQNFNDYEIEEAEISETSLDQSYEFQIEVGEEKLEVTINSKGQLSQTKTND